MQPPSKPVTPFRRPLTLAIQDYNTLAADCEELVKRKDTLSPTPGLDTAPLLEPYLSEEYWAEIKYKTEEWFEGEIRRLEDGCKELEMLKVELMSDVERLEGENVRKETGGRDGSGWRGWGEDSLMREFVDAAAEAERDLRGWRTERERGIGGRGR